VPSAPIATLPSNQLMNAFPVGASAANVQIGSPVVRSSA
jgi:hypothetical protein